MIKYLPGAACAVLLSLALLPAAAAPTDQSAGQSEQPPAAVVHAFNAKLLMVMKKAKSLGYKGRYQALEPAVDASFDVTAIARYSVGSHWQDFSADQRKQFVADLRQLTIGTYAERFDSYNGQHFEHISDQSRGARAIVNTAIVNFDGKRVTLDYVLQQNDNHWQIVNVIAKGISDLAVKRAQYTSVIEREGIPALLKKAKAKVAVLGSGAS